MPNIPHPPGADMGRPIRHDGPRSSPRWFSFRPVSGIRVLCDWGQGLGGLWSAAPSWDALGGHCPQKHPRTVLHRGKPGPCMVFCIQVRVNVRVN